VSQEFKKLTQESILKGVGVVMQWKIKYVVVNSKEDSEEKEIKVFAVNVFEAYYNAERVLKIIERGKVIKRIEVMQY
tara:strand:- start:764 stop:994 length:231 start_codon:yes stop_codon:yes gene_type:complete